MSDTYDIAERLRLWSPLIASGYEVPAAAAVMHAAAAEIERLHADLAQRTAERDEARRDACEFEAILCFNLRIPKPWSVNQESARIARDIAADRGWDCFEKEVKP